MTTTPSSPPGARDATTPVWLGVSVPDVRTLVTRLSTPRGVFGVGSVALLVALWAAAVPRPARSVNVFLYNGPVQQEGYDDTANPTQSEFLGPKFVGSRRPAQGLEGILGYAVAGMLAVILVVCLVLVVRGFLESRRRPPPAPDAAPDLDLAELALAVSSGQDARLTALSSGTPAEGVIAAWAHLEATLHAAQVPLTSARTSTEVTLEVLGRFDVDDATLRGLAELYREARWSRHALTEDDRARAAAAYRDLSAAVASAASAAPVAGGRRG